MPQALTSSLASFHQGLFGGVGEGRRGRGRRLGAGLAGGHGARAGEGLLPKPRRQPPAAVERGDGGPSSGRTRRGSSTSRI